MGFSYWATSWDSGLFILCCKYVAGLTQAGLYYLRGSWVRGLVTSVFVQDWVHIMCFGFLCGNVFVLYFMLVVLGGLPACGGIGGPFHRFVRFLRLVYLRGATSII